jgi:hypothetical protein
MKKCYNIFNVLMGQFNPEGQTKAKMEFIKYQIQDLIGTSRI